MMNPEGLRLALPKGSLEQPTLALFDAAGLSVKRKSDVDYHAEIDDIRIGEVRIMRPQEIPKYVAEGLFDFGITGRDCIEESDSTVEAIGVLEYSKSSTNPIRVVVAVAEDSPAKSIADLPDGVRIATEYPRLARRYFAEHGVEADISYSFGATEGKVPDIADAIVEIIETGRALRVAGLRVIDTILTSHTELIASHTAFANSAKRHGIEQIYDLLSGTLNAVDHVLLKAIIPHGAVDEVNAALPPGKLTTIWELQEGSGFVAECVLPKPAANRVISALRDAGAGQIIEMPVGKIIS